MTMVDFLLIYLTPSQNWLIYVRLRFYRRLHINAIIMIKVIRLEMFSLIRITFI